MDPVNDAESLAGTNSNPAIPRRPAMSLPMERTRRSAGGTAYNRRVATDRSGRVSDRAVAYRLR